MIKPIETKYKKIKFKSRLEARWATFFDKCGVDWEYEPEGFDLGDDVLYMPNFRLKDVPLSYMAEGCNKPEDRFVYKNLWVEVKRNMDSDSAENILKFSKDLDNRSDIIVVGPFPKGDDWFDIVSEMDDYMLHNVYQLGEDVGADDMCCYYQIGARWTGFTSYLGADVTGTLAVYGTYKWWSRIGLDIDKTTEAYNYARNYRFDHREEQAY